MTATQTHPTLDMKNNVQVGLFNPTEVDLYWPQIETMLLQVPHTWQYYTLAFFHESVKNGNIQIWGAGVGGTVKLVYFTSLVTYPNMKTLQVIWAGGKLENFLHAIITSLESFAKQEECDEIEVLGRGGWEKVLLPHGFKRKVVCLSRPVEKGRMQ